MLNKLFIKVSISLSIINHYAKKLRARVLCWKFEAVGKGCSIARGVSFSPYLSIMLGSRVAFRKGVVLAGRGRLEIGDNTVLHEGVVISAYEKMNIGKDCMMATRVSILDVSHNYESRSMPISLQGYKTSPVIIGDDVWIGANAVILKGARVGDGAIIAANSVVSEEVAPYTIVGGSPARFIKERPL